jgi:hypothetical protein
MGQKLIQYFVEWCQTPDCRVKGICFEDCSYLYDVEGVNISWVLKRSSENNIYIGIPTSILQGVDPCLEAAVQRLQRIYESTFWSLYGAYDFCCASIELAKRGLNVDQMAIFLGPGGVGLSLYTAHIHAMYGPRNHRFFDPNIFYQDDELRKQIELFVGAFIFSGQERPTGMKARMREDLLKKFLTSEGIAGRLPYAILTKMVRLKGWKRIEMNKLFRFDDIKESNFESILRRCAVIRIQARFFDRGFLDLNFPDKNWEEFGIFARDPDAQDFLVSSVGILAGHKLQLGYAVGHSLEECRATITNYTRLGGDLGATEKYIRIACSLPPVVESGVGSIVPCLVSASQEADLSDVKALAIHRHYVRLLLRGSPAKSGKMYGLRDYYTLSFFNQVIMPNDESN